MTIIKENNIKYKVIGNGSNLIFSDKPYDGVIIKLDSLNNLKIDDKTIVVGAGYNLMKLAYKDILNGLNGLRIATVSCSIGGFIRMNAGAYGSDMGYVVKSIRVITPDLTVKEMSNKELNFHYRDSFLQHNEGYICVEATIVLKKGKSREIISLIEDRKKRRMESKTLEYTSAGSVFRNPTNDFAGHLIEISGLKGKMIGGALVSPKHANFIVNHNHATADDIRNLIMHVKEEVKKKQNVDLLIEQEFVNWE